MGLSATPKKPQQFRMQFRISTPGGKVQLEFSLPNEMIACVAFEPELAREFARKLNEAAAWIENPTKAKPS